METVIEELISFLKKKDPKLQLEACNTVLGLTGCEEGKNFIIANFTIVKCLVDHGFNASAPSDIRLAALQILINLSSESTFCHKLTEQAESNDFYQKLVDSVLLKDNQHANLSCQLLSNITRFTICAEKVVDMLNSEFNVSKRTLQCCINALNMKNYNAFCSLDYLANFLCNITQTTAGRKLLCSNVNFLPKLLPFIGNMESLVRRRGIVGTVRNCCFERDYHKWLLSDEVDILPRLLLPLAGPEEFDEEDTAKLPDDLQYLGDDKTREPEPEIRKMLVESIHKLCTIMECRYMIKDKNAYVILRELHKWETDPDVEASILDLVQLFIGDEPEKGMENLDEVVIPDDVQKKFNSQRRDLSIE